MTHGKEGRIKEDFLLALRETMEEMAFAVVDALDEDDRDNYAFDEESALWSKVSIDSRLKGVSSVGILLSRELVDFLINNMYSDSVVMEKDQQEKDTIAELTNILVGKFMIRVEDIMGDFSLSLPEVGIGGAAFSSDSLDLECIIAEKYYMQAVVEM